MPDVCGLLSSAGHSGCLQMGRKEANMRRRLLLATVLVLSSFLLPVTSYADEKLSFSGEDSEGSYRSRGQGCKGTLHKAFLTHGLNSVFTYRITLRACLWRDFCIYLRRETINHIIDRPSCRLHLPCPAAGLHLRFGVSHSR